MKKVFLKYILFAVLFVFAGLSYIQASGSTINNLQVDIIKRVECKYGQCSAIAKLTKKRCKHCVSKRGDTKCWQHD